MNNPSKLIIRVTDAGKAQFAPYFGITSDDIDYLHMFRDLRESGIWGIFRIQLKNKTAFDTLRLSGFGSKLPSGRYEASSNRIFAPRFILSPKMSSNPKIRRSGHKIHLISSFLGFILAKSDQK